MHSISGESKLTSGVEINVIGPIPCISVAGKQAVARVILTKKGSPGQFVSS